MDADSKWGGTVRNVIDFALLVLLGLAVLLITLLAHPFVRGYYCDDDSIMYPNKDNTVTTLALALGVVLLPLVLMGGLELTSENAWRPWKSGACACCKKLPKGAVKLVKRSGAFLFGAGVTDLIVEMGKITIGRLRPHFLDVCRPAQPCVDTGYVVEYTCTGDPAAVEEARKSFPSGHAAMSFYSAVYLMMYLQCEFRWRNPRLLRHVLQLLLMAAAWFTALSRVTDYKHHWSDILAGILIGSIVAVLTVSFVSDLRLRCPTCRQQDNELLIHDT